MELSDIRRIVAKEAPLLLGSNSDRVAPVHIINGFMAAQYGVSSVEERIRELIHSETAQDKALSDEYGFVKGNEWIRDEDCFNQFQRDMRVVVDPDRRTWVKQGSLFPVASGFVGDDPSDDGFGGMLWKMADDHLGEDYWELLEGLLDPAEVNDPVTAVGRIVSKGAGVERKRRRDIDRKAWFVGSESEEPGAKLASYYCEFLKNLTAKYREAPGASRLLALQHLARGLHLCACLGVLVGPRAARTTDNVNGADDIMHLVVWGGQPPGSNSEPGIKASARSIQYAVQKHRHAVSEIMATELGEVELQSGIPKSQERKAALKQCLIDGGSSPSNAASAVEAIDDSTKGESDIREWCDTILDEVYGNDVVAREIKNMAKKVGFAAPSRGRGRIRFVVETPVLATLVAGLVPAGRESCTFEEFVDLAREKLGLIFGVGTRDRGVTKELDFMQGGGLVHRLLSKNEDLLRQRMIRAGLAREYSDGNTEVVYG